MVVHSKCTKRRIFRWKWWFVVETRTKKKFPLRPAERTRFNRFNVVVAGSLTWIPNGGGDFVAWTLFSMFFFLFCIQVNGSSSSRSRLRLPQIKLI